MRWMKTFKMSYSSYNIYAYADSSHCVMLLRQAMKMATVKIFQWIRTCGHSTTVYLENSC